MRATNPATPAELANEVDAVLLRDLAEIAGISEPVVSPVDYAEIQLSVGCADDSRACLESIARAAGVEALLVRSLHTDDAGHTRLALRYLDSASSEEPAVVESDAAEHTQADLVSAVPRLVRTLFGIPEVATPAPSGAAAQGQPASSPDAARSAPAPREAQSSVVPWILIGTGAAVLTTGIVIGAVAARDFKAWKSSSVVTREEADQAKADFDALQKRAVLADVLMPVGAIALGLGATLLILDLSDGDERETLAVAPAADGAMLSVSGTFGGAW